MCSWHFHYALDTILNFYTFLEEVWIATLQLIRKQYLQQILMLM